MQRSKTFRLALVATGEWVMVLPAAVFLMAAALRFLQPSQYEPAHTSWIISQWAATHVSRLVRQRCSFSCHHSLFFWEAPPFYWLGATIRRYATTLRLL